MQQRFLGNSTQQLEMNLIYAEIENSLTSLTIVEEYVYNVKSNGRADVTLPIKLD